MENDRKSAPESSGIELPTGLVAATLVFVLYLRTLAPTVLGFEPPVVFDSAMLQTASYTLGIAHPTGYSTYLMLTHLFTYLPFGDAAYRVNLASAVFGAVAVFVVYLIALRLTDRVLASLTGALAFGVSPLFWGQAIIAEVYTLNAFFIALVVFVLLVWRDTGRERFLLIACLLAGISLTHHLTSALVVPAGAAFFLMTKPPRFSLRRFLPKGLGLFALGLLPYLYFPVRAAMNAPLNETDPSSVGRFLLLISGGSFVFKDYDAGAAGRPEEAGSGGVLPRLIEYFGYVRDQFPLLLVAVGVVGIFFLVAKNRPAAALLGIPFAGSMLHALLYGYDDYFIFLIPACLVFGVLIAVGAAAISGAISARPRGFFATLLVALLAFAAAGNFASVDRSGDLAGRETIEAVARYAEPDSTVLHHRSSLWYMVLVEGRRTDLTLIDPYRTSFIRYTDIVWPGDYDAGASARKFGTGDPTGVEAALIASEEGAVYLLGSELKLGIADAGDFRAAGFEVVPADPDGELYELVPPERGV